MYACNKQKESKMDMILFVILSLSNVNTMSEEEVYAHQMCDDEIYWMNQELLNSDLDQE